MVYVDTLMNFSRGCNLKQNSIKDLASENDNPLSSLFVPCPILHRGDKLAIFGPLGFFRFFLCICTEVSVVMIYLMLVW